MSTDQYAIYRCEHGYFACECEVEGCMHYRGPRDPYRPANTADVVPSTDSTADTRSNEHG
jgi:hypothetical protein